MDIGTSTGTTDTRTVTATLACDLIDTAGAVIPVVADLRYDVADPFAVSATFHTAAGTVRWVFARDLLLDGRYEPSGDGDVHVWPCLDDNARAVVLIELCSPHGEALVQIPSATLAPFADQMTDVVARGAEACGPDLDAALATLLDSDRA